MTRSELEIRNMVANQRCHVTHSHDLKPGQSYGGAQLTDEDIARLGLAPGDGHVNIGRGTVQIGGRRIDTWLITVEHRALRVTSRVHLLNGRGGIVVYDELLDLNDGFRRKGFATIALALQVRTAILAGARMIRAQVSGGDDDRFIGHIVWPKLGFDGPIPAQIWDAIPVDVRIQSGMDGQEEKSLIAFLASCPAASQAWAEHGRGFDMTMRLDAAAPAVSRHLNLLRRAAL